MALRVQAAPAALPRARQDQRRGHRPARTRALGGIRIVKTYTAEKREELVFTEGRAPAVPERREVDHRRVGDHGVLDRHRRRDRRADDRRSAVASILDGRMTLGEFVMYIFFTGLMAAPLVQIASIGTQITEAFAGLDRIREIRCRWRPRTSRTLARAAGRRDRRRRRVRGRQVRVQRRRAGAEARLVPRAAPARRRRSSARAGPARARSSAS